MQNRKTKLREKVRRENKEIGERKLSKNRQKKWRENREIRCTEKVER